MSLYDTWKAQNGGSSTASPVSVKSNSLYDTWKAQQGASGAREGASNIAPNKITTQKPNTLKTPSTKSLGLSDEEKTFVANYEAIPNRNVFQRNNDFAYQAEYDAKQKNAEKYNAIKLKEGKSILESLGKKASDFDTASMGDVAASFVKGLNPFKLKENTLNETLDSFKSGVNSKNVREWAKAQGLNDSQVEAVVKYVDAEKGKKETAEAQKFASDNKALATLKSAITNASESTVNTLDKTASFLEGSPITNNARLNTTNAMREEVSKDMGKVGKFLYGTGNSILDMGTAMATSVGTGGSSLVSAGLMGLEKQAK